MKCTFSTYNVVCDTKCALWNSSCHTVAVAEKLGSLNLQEKKVNVNIHDNDIIFLQNRPITIKNMS